MKSRVMWLVSLFVLLGALGWWWQRGRDLSPGQNGNIKWPQNQAQRNKCRAAIFGRVLDGDDKAVAQVLVRLADKRARSDAQGRFALYDLQNKTYRLELERAGYVVAGPPGQQHANIRLPRRDDGALGCLFDLDVHIHRPAFVQGQVLKSGQPQPAGLDLLVLRAQGLQKDLGPYALEQVQQTDAQGRFALAVTPGLLQIVASAAAQGEAQSDELHLRDGQRLSGVVIDLDDVDLPLRPGLSGQVQDEQGKAIGGASLSLRGDALGRELRLRSDAQGHFAFAELALDRAHAQLQIFVQAPGYYSKIRTISVSSDENKALRLVLQKGEGVFGRVMDDQGQAAPRAYVIARLGGRPKLLRSDQQGFFRWPRSAVHGPGEAWAVSPFAADSAKRTLIAGVECLLQLGPGADLGGRVVDERGRAVKAFRVAIERIDVKGARPYRSTVYPVFRTDERGSELAQAGQFDFAALRPGRYVLAAAATDYATTRTEWIQVTAGQSYQGLRIVLHRGATVYGQVTDRDGDAVPGAQVRLAQFRAAFKSQRVSTDANGRYRLQHLEAGRRSLRVTAPGYLTQVAAGVEVPEHGELRRDVTLARARPGAEFSFAGIGAVLMRSRGGVIIRQVMPGQGAAAQGLRHGDKIVSVDGDDVDDLDLEQVVAKIRGEEGEAVSLDIERPGVGPISVEVERGQVVVERRPSPHNKRKP